MAEELENQEELQEEESQNEQEEQDERLLKRKKKTESSRQQSVIRTLLVVGILILVNIISINLFFRLDLTPNKIYTLSDASKNMVGKLDDKLVVKAYFTDNLPSPYNNTRRYLQELLDDYHSNSSGKLTYEIISPSDESELEKDAQRYGIQPVQIQTFKNDRAEAMKAYMGMVILYGGKQETIGLIGGTENLEYDITGTIKRLTEKELKKVGILSGGSFPGTDKIAKTTQTIAKYYSITPVDASKNTPIPADIPLLIVFSPKAQQQNQMMGMQQPPTPTVPENIKFAIDQYIMGGGRVIFFLNKVTVQSQQQFQIAQNISTGLEDMLESYGLKIRSDILADKECAMVSIPVQQDPFPIYTQVPFPYYPRIININRDLPSFAPIPQIFLGFSSSLDTAVAMIKGLKVTPLITTSPKTATYNEFAIVQVSGKNLPDTMFKSSNLVVGAIYNGKYSSFYKDKPVPADTAAGSTAPVTTIKPEGPPEGRLVLFGNGDFVQDEFRGPAENTEFFASLIDYMTDDVGLSQIRQKDANPKQLNPMEDSSRTLTKFALLIGPPLIVLVYGLLRWKKKKK
ncbi:MAG TPA: Gldg family protein [Ignavibacteria bacterium]|nr:Gldg family protein [Ignavibacteria bacterium]